MSDFTYTVFVIVASLIGSLVALFAAGVIGVLVHDPHRRNETTEPAELRRAA
jgi:hypothetical protein